MSGTPGPAAVRSAAARLETFLVMLATAVDTQEMMSACLAHGVTSLPLMDTVISPMCPRWAVMKASAAAACVVVG